MSLPAPVQQVLQKEADSIEFFKLAANDRIECTLNGHSIPADHIGALERFVGCDFPVQVDAGGVRSLGLLWAHG